MKFSCIENDFFISSGSVLYFAAQLLLHIVGIANTSIFLLTVIMLQGKIYQNTRLGVSSKLNNWLLRPIPNSMMRLFAVRPRLDCRSQIWFSCFRYNMRCIMKKPALCISENSHRSPPSPWPARENMSLGFLTRYETNQAVQPQRMSRCLKFEELYCSGHKGADQLPGNRSADQCLLFSV